MSVTNFIDKNYRHFNAATLRDAAISYMQFTDAGNKMMVTLAGAMSTAELGISLAKMIRANKVHAITCTGANLEEDIFNLVAHSHYKRVPHYRDLTPKDEEELLAGHYNRVTDTCIPEAEAIRKIESHIFKLWKNASDKALSKFPHEFMYDLIKSGVLEIDPEAQLEDSWLVAACEKNLPIFVPGWEDSTLGNIFASYCYNGELSVVQTMATGIDYMIELIDWYKQATVTSSIGFFQIGGGIAGDFPICVVPLIHQDMQEKVPVWGYFCQISDSTTSYGSYSGAVPNEKITWGKLRAETPKFVVESDASIVAPLMFAYILGE